MKFGVLMYQRADAMNVVEFARVAEQCGCESVWFGDHTHRPVTEAELPLFKLGKLHSHAYMMDQWVVLGAIATVTNLTIGTAITLVMQRDPITLAKEIATLDQLSGGRVILGVGFGHSREPYITEMMNHGTKSKERFEVTRERILAMREIWTKEEAEFHGKYVNFDPIWSFPKPVQAGGPPVLLGSIGGPTRESWERRLGWLLEYCDGWLPNPRETDLAHRIQELQSLARENGRPPYDITIPWSKDWIAGNREETGALTERDIAGLESIGVGRIIYHLECGPADVIVPQLKDYEKLIRRFP